ncbi:hypothetical protein EZV62_027139 [Acer yangbiense]|uniref:NB-ARC domain-containing protein n=1 Tax=Acer yangbiense TaxID=1000413 RepID=A0A5C7GTD6_9ROSI|nr:hypothetical protein EZV62_027139 [Acer yangbiense]
MRDIRERLDEIAEERSKFHLIEGGVQGRLDVLENRQTGSIIAQSEVYGRDEDKEKIIQRLVEIVADSDDISVYPIVGIGGLGKTTLAQMVFNDERAMRHFELRIWVCISEDFGVKRIIKAIIESATGSACEALDLDPLQKRLQGILNGKRYLLVLDDVWNEDQEKWDRLLFKERAFGHDTEGHPNHVALGKEIMKKCGGVPLAVKSLGSMMRYKSEENQWQSVVESELWNLSQDENSILPALRLSYSNLPSKLRQCFAYCAIFPKGFTIEKELLIQLWMANGFIPFTEKLDPEDIGNEICNELCWRSFLEDIEKGDDFYYGRRFKMHDLVHDLAQSIMEDECFSKEIESSTNISKRTCHFTSVNSQWNSYPFPKALYQVETLRTFLVHSAVGKKRGCHLAELKDLNLGGYLHIKHLQRVVNPLNANEANLVGKRNLRRLDLYWKDDDSDLQSLEDAEKVLEGLEPHANLEHFGILGYKGVQFPFWMRDHILNNVVHLSLSDCHNCSHLPPLSLLASLRTLSLSRISRVMYIDDNFQGAGIMRGFPSLQNLTISYLPSLQRFSREDGRELLPCLTSLDISKCPKLTLPRLPSVTELRVSDCNDILLGSISNLKSLTLLHVWDNDTLIDLPQCMLLNLASLNQLSIRNFSKLKCLPTELVGLSALEALDISWCDEFESFPEQGMEGLKSLKNLQLHECRKFTTLSEGLQHLSCLEKLTLNGCPEMVALPDGIKYLNSLQHIQISSDRIEIQSSSIKPCGFEVIEWSFWRYEEPIGSPKLAKLAILPEALQYVLALQSLYISSYPNLASLPHWLGNLTSLQTLIIYDCPKLSSLPASIQGLTKLHKLAIQKCPELVKRYMRSYWHGMTTMQLTNMIISTESFPEQGMECLKSLKNLRLHDCRKFTTLSEGLQHLSCLEKLTLTGCPELVALPDGIKYLNSLQHLQISGDRIEIQSSSFQPCGFEPTIIGSSYREEPIGSPTLAKLAVLPEALRYVPALQSLYISSYPNLASLPHWLGNLTSLQTLLICDCPKLSSLPASIQGLTQLQKLAFWGCPELVKRCEKETGEDWYKIAHIPNVYVNYRVQNS